MVPHIRMLDIFSNGVGYEVAVVKEDKNNGDIYFIRTDYLDQIDYGRLVQILRRRDAGRLPLWDLLSGITLGNGMNALEYFHQYVQVKTRSGEVMKPNPKRAGMPTGTRTIDPTNFDAVNKTRSVGAEHKGGRPSKAEKEAKRQSEESQEKGQE